MHPTTIAHLLSRSISFEELGYLLNCTAEHAQDIVFGNAPSTSREKAIIRLCANVFENRLRPILDEMKARSEWKPIPGYSKYEVSSSGHVRRSASGRGSMPGHILAHKISKSGHHYVNIAKDGERTKPVAVHRAVCLAFNGLPPTQEHVVCHRNDVKSENTRDNLYWGTHQDNAEDRWRNDRDFSRIDTHRAQRLVLEGKFSMEKIKKEKKKQMLRNVSDRDVGAALVRERWPAGVDTGTPENRQ